jgi:hypothetical protein
MTENNRSLIRRDQNGYFLPGVSGNPSGRPKGAGEIRELAKQYVPDALAKIASLVRSDDEKVALAASQEILNRVFGRPVQSVESDVRTLNVTDTIREMYLAVVSGKAGGYGAPPTIDAEPSTATMLPPHVEDSDTATEW